MNEVDEKSFDMRAIMILISHNHDSAVTQSSGIFIFFFHLKTNNFDQVLQFLVLQNYTDACIPYVHKFTFEWEYSVSISTDNL